MKKTYLKLKSLIPSLILCLICIITFISIKIWDKFAPSVDYDTIPFNKYYFALLTVAITMIIYFVRRPLYKYFFSLTLLLGLFNAINFSTFDFFWTFSLGTLNIKPTAFVVGLLTIVLNLKKIKHYLLDKP